MPTSPVKQVSEPLQTQTITRFSRDNCQRFAPPLMAFLFLLCLGNISGSNAQTLNVRIKVTSVAPAKLRIELTLPGQTKTLSFRNTYAGVIGLGERIDAVEASNSNGEHIVVKKLAPGEFKASDSFSRVSYDVNVTEPARPAQMSHVTWLRQDQGLLMLSDLLPQPTETAGRFASTVISLEAPAGWKVTSNLKRAGSQFSTSDPDTAVFLVGSSVQETQKRLVSTDFAVITAGEWPFSAGDAFKIAERIIEEHSLVTGFQLKSNAVLMLIPYPGEAGPERWSAETRGNAVVLVLGKQASRRKVLARLGIVLSHELFHLWVPNSLELKGDYDWFFEGFTLYHALRTDLRLGLITFDDYLETIASVYDAYRASPDGDRLSLLEASERRWTTSSSLVYEKGMLVAFIYDLKLRSLTTCGASLDNIYADLFRLPVTGQGSANETIIGLLSGREGLRSFARDYVENAGKLSLDATLSTYGIEIRQDASGAGATKLVVSGNLSESQRKLLNCIGYKK
jgi:predicted metalloprotease with PDZ domain